MRLDSFSIRPDSGGNGKHKEGNGVIRALIFSESVELSLLSQHRKYSPYGLQGGEAGKKGKQYVIRANGEKISLKGMSHCFLNPNDQFIIKTPGGGAYGEKE